MRKLIVSSVTIEEAVALLINLDYIPDGFTLLDMTAAFLEEVEVNHHNAKVNHLPPSEIAALQIRMDACAARHSLAQSLTSALRNEINKPNGGIAALNDNSSIEPQLTVESLINWASGFGIGLPVLALLDDKASVKEPCWEDVTIKIYKDDMVEDYPNYRLAYFSENTGPKGKEKYFQEIGLMGKRKNIPNSIGGILIGLSLGKQFPSGINPGKVLEGSAAVAITRVRSALKRLTSIETDPFTFNKTDGYKPRFKLVDATNVGNERAKSKAHHESYDENASQHNDDYGDEVA